MNDSHARISSRRIFASLALLAGSVLSFATAGCGSQRMSQVVAENVQILRRFETEQVIAPALIANAKAVAVIRESEGALIVGASGGEGLLVRKTETGWSPPLAIEISSASIGIQIGGQVREIVLIFNSGAAVENMFASGMYGIGRAEGVAGNAQVRTGPSSPEPEVVPYVRTGGFFGGVSLNGLGFRPDPQVNNAAYGQSWTPKRVLAGELPPPPGSMTLWNMLDELAK